jgi:flagellar motor protein MotB
MNVRHGCLLGMLAATVLLGGTGCSNTGKERDALLKQNKDYANELAANKAQLDEQQKKIDDLNMKLLAGQTPATTEPAPTTGPADSTPDIGTVDAGTNEGGGLSIRKNKRGETELEIVGDVLFAPGKATIKPAAQKTLEKAASIIKSKYAGSRLRIEGHTDPTKVGNSGWDDNYDLGAARARAVLLVLKSHGVPEKSMYIASFGANELRSTKNYALDRRVDIVVEK